MLPISERMNSLESKQQDIRLAIADKESEDMYETVKSLHSRLSLMISLHATAL